MKVVKIPRALITRKKCFSGCLIWYPYKTINLTKLIVIIIS